MFSQPEGMPGWECFLPRGLSNWFIRDSSGNIFYLLSLARHSRAALFSASHGCPQKPSHTYLHLFLHNISTDFEGGILMPIGKKKKQQGKAWGKRREPMSMSKCFEAREADDILNICPKNQSVFSLVCKNHHYWTPCSYSHGTRTSPGVRQGVQCPWMQAWRRTGNRNPGVLPISVQQHIWRRKCSQLIFSRVWNIWQTLSHHPYIFPFLWL